MADYPEEMDETTAGEGAESEEEPKNEGAATELVSASFFGDKPLEVGGECTVRIVHVYDDQVEIEYVKEKERESPMKGSMDKLESMAQ